ncbi:MAG: hypothetical protein EHM35_04430 [Planctomycetaceae bacterium]|nr:MAG: hypothetical protein EHM35_04430 [Planctomycetaceae bacterium]
MDNPAELTVLSLCSGYGGIELGLARALANPLRVVAVEVEAYALANLEAKAAEGRLAIEALWPDLRTFPAERFRGCFDFVLAGYPCQPFSVAGKREGENDPRHLWPHIAAIVRAVEPVWCFFENVPGHLSLGFPAVYRSLRDLGYSVEAGLFTAAECGAPHKRERLFILAHAASGRGRHNDGAIPGTDDRARRESPSILRSETSGGGGNQADDVPDAPRRGRRELRGPQQQAGGGLAESGGDVADTSSQRVQGPEPTRPILALRSPDEHGGSDRWPAGPGQPQYEWEEPRTVVYARGPQSRGLSGSGRQALSEAGRTGADLEHPTSTGAEPAEQSGQRTSPESASPVVDAPRLHGAGAGRQLRGRRGVCEAGGPVGQPQGDNERRISKPSMHRQGVKAGGSSRQENTEIEPGLGRAVDGPSCRVDRLRLLGNGVVPAQAERALKSLMKEAR